MKLRKPVLIIGLLTATIGAEAKENKVKNYKKPPMEELKKKLTPEQMKVTQHEATEAPFKNAYWDNHEDGIYVDMVTGEPRLSWLYRFV